MAKGKGKTEEIEVDNYGGGGAGGNSSGAKGVIPWDKSQRASGAQRRLSGPTLSIWLNVKAPSM